MPLTAWTDLAFGLALLGFVGLLVCIAHRVDGLQWRQLDQARRIAELERELARTRAARACTRRRRA